MIAACAEVDSPVQSCSTWRKRLYRQIATSMFSFLGGFSENDFRSCVFHFFLFYESVLSGSKLISVFLPSSSSWVSGPVRFL